MKKIWLIAGMTIFMAHGSLASAEEVKARDISGRIKELRERLSQFQARGEEPKTAGGAVKTQEQDPEKLTDQLEHRQDAKMLVLFHDQGTKAEASGIQNPTLDDERETNSDSVNEAEPSAVEKALQRLRESRLARQTRLAKADLPGTGEKK
ncbi:MAG TPA: hypothetical protein PKO06_22970 [Candidatus Ozemobacteraceae bacterium]|nr:hypothetical protein [Candidatus Ozemobacteraceae bacterium]